MKLFFKSFACMLLAAVPVSVCAASNHQLRDILSVLQSNISPDQYRLFEGAIRASPALASQLDELAISGQLKKFKVGEASTLPPASRPFGAYVSGTTWAFTPAFVQQQAKTRYYDVVMSDDVLGDNMVFALGELAYRTKSASGIAAAEQALHMQMSQEMAAARKASQPFNADNVMHQHLAIELGNTALGFIQGWNDMLDAAVQENGGKTLTVRQVVSLTMNFRYRAVFIRAMRLPDHKLNYANGGRIEPTDANRDAIASALATMSMYDLQ